MGDPELDPAGWAATEIGLQWQERGTLKGVKGDAAVLGMPQGRDANRTDIFMGNQVNF